MKTFKQYLKKLKEDKILTKEDEGVTQSGDISAPSDSTPLGDIQTPPSGPGGSITSGDVLGNCDHKNDGFFGPGCFHRPFPIYGYPVSKKKKKKKNK